MSEPIAAQPTPEFGTRPEDLEQFNAMVSEVDTYNKQFSLGSMMAKMMIGQIEVNEKAGELEQAGLLEDEANETAQWLRTDENLTEEQQIAHFVLGGINAPVLDETGLGLSPLRKNFTIYGPGGTQDIGSVRLRVADGGKFVGFLNNVPKDIADEAFKKSVGDVVADVAQEAYSAVQDGADDVVAETLAYADGLITALDAIEIPKNELLDNIVHYGKQGILQEYVAADLSGVLRGINSHTFSPSEWQQDATPEFLAGRWQAVLDVIGVAQKNPKAVDFAKELIDKASEHLAFARKNWQELKAERDYGGGYGQGFEEIFDTVSVKLMELGQ